LLSGSGAGRPNYLFRVEGAGLDDLRLLVGSAGIHCVGSDVSSLLATAGGGGIPSNQFSAGSHDTKRRLLRQVLGHQHGTAGSLVRVGTGYPVVDGLLNSGHQTFAPVALAQLAAM